MKRTLLVALAAVTALGLGACSKDDAASAAKDADTTATSSAEATSAASVAMPVLPTADDLNAVIAVATDPGAPTEAKVDTVENAQAAPELFEVMTRAKEESGANFVVVDPILPGYTPQSVLATVTFTLPDREPQNIDNVEFVNVNGKWQLSQTWACNLITNVVAPDQVPPMCQV